MRKRSIFDMKDKHEKKLKIARLGKQDMKVFSVSSQNNSSHLSFHNSKGKGKGGFVVQGKTIIVKTNYEVAGKMKRDGSRATRRDVGSHASASLSYMNNHGAEDIKDEALSNIYNEEGERLTKEEYKDLKQAMESGEEFQAMRRIMIDPGQQDYLTREEMNQIVRESLNDFMRKTDKEFDYKFAIHTDKLEFGGNVHAHILVTGNARDIHINKEQLQTLKQTISEKTQEVLQSKELDKQHSIDKMIEKEITLSKEKSEDKSLTHAQKIDKEIDGKLDDKFREEELDKIINELYNNNQKDNSQSLSL